MKVISCTFDVISLFLVPVCWLPYHMRPLWSCCFCLISCRFLSLLEFGSHFCDIQTVGRPLVQLVVCRYLYKKPEVMLCYGVHSIKLAAEETLGIHHLCRDPTAVYRRLFFKVSVEHGGPESAWTWSHSTGTQCFGIYCLPPYIVPSLEKGLASISCDFLKSACLVDSVRCFSFPFSLFH